MPCNPCCHASLCLITHFVCRAYARDRVAGRSLNKITKESPTGPAEPIINHPSVRQLLLFQKSIAEGGRSMVFDCAKRADVMEEAEANGDKDLAKKIDDRLGFMTPILKVDARCARLLINVLLF
jgi:alkylation response protein AidB-like acyl-CoA dehydrogenase